MNCTPETDYTPKQCRLAAAAMEAGEPMHSTKAIRILLAHAEALERLAEKDAALAKLKHHADAMALELDWVASGTSPYKHSIRYKAVAAYHAAFPEEKI